MNKSRFDNLIQLYIAFIVCFGYLFNMYMLSAIGVALVVINEFHKKENILGIAEWIKGANKYFLQKFKFNENCLNAVNLSPVDNKTVLEFVEILKPNVKKIETRGYDF